MKRPREERPGGSEVVEQLRRPRWSGPRTTRGPLGGAAAITAGISQTDRLVSAEPVRGDVHTYTHTHAHIHIGIYTQICLQS